MVSRGAKSAPSRLIFKSKSRGESFKNCCRCSNRPTRSHCQLSFYKLLSTKLIPQKNKSLPRRVHRLFQGRVLGFRGSPPKGKTIIEKAQPLVARKCGILEDDQELDHLTLQQYIDMYQKPLSNQTLVAMAQLAEVSETNKQKKKDKKKKKKKEMFEKKENKKQASQLHNGASPSLEVAA
jgi:hypothetical protein